MRAVDSEVERLRSLLRSALELIECLRPDPSPLTLEIREALPSDVQAVPAANVDLSWTFIPGSTISFNEARTLRLANGITIIIPFGTVIHAGEGGIDIQGGDPGGAVDVFDPPPPDVPRCEYCNHLVTNHSQRCQTLRADWKVR